MPITPTTPSTGRPKGAKRKSASTQLSESHRQLLARLWFAELAALAGTEEQQLEVRNQGVRWSAAAMAEALGKSVPSISRSLGSLEDRRLIWCLATGKGTGRRVSHVKLCAEAVDVAKHQLEYGMSADQRRRRDSALTTADLKAGLAAGRVPPWVAEMLAADPFRGHLVNTYTYKE